MQTNTNNNVARDAGRKVQITLNGKVVARSRNLRGLLDYGRKNGVDRVRLFRCDSGAGGLFIVFSNGALTTVNFASFGVAANWCACRRSWPVPVRIETREELASEIEKAIAPAGTPEPNESTPKLIITRYSDRRGLEIGASISDNRFFGAKPGQGAPIPFETIKGDFEQVRVQLDCDWELAAFNQFNRYWHEKENAHFDDLALFTIRRAQSTTAIA